MGLSRSLPFVAFAFVIASAASMGIPLFSGFAAEVTILLGVWKVYPMAVWITGAGMVLVAAFTLRALKKTFLGDATASASSHASLSPPISWAEKCGAGLLILATLGVGLYPKLLLDRIMPAVETMRFLK
jgi:NADH-quinone oxidoreductase subunit M